MFGRLLTVIILAGAIYWYWTGPYQEQHNPDPAQSLENDIEAMQRCVRGQHYKAGATGISDANPEEVCAERFNLYFYEGQWRKKGG